MHAPPPPPPCRTLSNTQLPIAGGKKILARVGGKDASKQFWKYHNEGILKKYKPSLQIGSLDSKPKPEPKPEPVPEAKPSVTLAAPVPAKAAPVQSTPQEEAEALEQFGSQIPFADPSWYQNVRTVYLFIQLSMKLIQISQMRLWPN